MNYPYYQDPLNGVAPSGRFSAPMSRANISNPITPHGIPYTAHPSSLPQQQKPSRGERIRNFLQTTALVGTALYAVSQLANGGDDDGPSVDIKDVTPIRNKVQKFLESGAKTGDVDVEGRDINVGEYEYGEMRANDRGDAGYPGDLGRKIGGNYLTTDPEEVGGLNKTGKAQLTKFRKSLNIPTTEGRPQTEHAGLDEEIVGVSPEQSALGKTWAFVDNDRFFDHPDVDNPDVVNDEAPNVPHAGKQHLDNYVDRLVDSAIEHVENTSRYKAPATSSFMREVEISPEFGVEVTTFPGKRQQKRAAAAQKAGIPNMTDKYYYDQLQLKETDSREVQQSKVRKQVELMEAMKAGSEGAVSMGNSYNELLKKPYGGHIEGRYAEEGMVDAVYPQSPLHQAISDPW